MVVDTINFESNSRQARGGSNQLHVIERFTKLSNGDLHYGFTVEDSTVWTSSWSGEYTWRATNEKVYEYACHEGNYSMGGILRGARLLEKDMLKQKYGQIP